MDSWIHDNIRALQPLFQTAEPERLRGFIARKKEMSEASDLYLAELELLPALLRDERHGEKLAELYEWALAKYAEFFSSRLKNLTSDQVRGFSQLLAAFVDGLGIQRAIDSECFKVDAAYAMLESVLNSWFESQSEG